MPTVATSKGITVSLLAALTTGTGTAVAVPITSKHQRYTVTGAGTISAGTLIIEESNDPAFSGTWSQIVSITASALTGGAEQVVHAFGTLGFVRARIGTNITGGGTVAAEIVTD